MPIVQEAGLDPGPVLTGAENLAPPPGIDPRTVQPVASRYTDCANPALCVYFVLFFTKEHDFDLRSGFEGEV